MKLFKSLITPLLLLTVMFFASSLAIQAKTQTTDKQITIVKESPGNAYVSSDNDEYITIVIGDYTRQDKRTDNFALSQKIDLTERVSTSASKLKPKLKIDSHKTFATLAGENGLQMQAGLLRHQGKVNRFPVNHYILNLIDKGC